ncbi:BamA/TamA family outer membrane protein [Mesohalobacter halotolerans]|uniref:Bacterial surface antigen (D15) domain-containing protein n=1 Tax=Mesohalobacter halotolerans TaxID=1883405 RepID=A0A4U5TVJ2_9FLAO|nr:hypothetical protein [Mesohalobacter halotolerans]TKS57624.1 hypothetical protein FCN74_04200 [Mesohalobacter halotolerans]
MRLHSENIKQDSLLKTFIPNQSFTGFKNLEAASKEIIAELQQKGYLNLRAYQLEPANDSVYQLQLNLRKKYNVVYIKNHSAFTDVFNNMEPYVKIEDLPERLFVTLNQLSKEGKPFSQVKLKEIEFNESDTVFAKIDLNESPKRTLDKIVIRGYDKFPQAFLKHYCNVKIGAVFNREQLLKQSEQLDALRFVNQTKTPQVQFTKDSTNLFLYLDRSQANSFDGFLGFNNSDENDFQLIGNIDLSLVNNFNAGEEINLNYRNDGNAQEWFDVGLRLPYIFQSRFSIEAGLNFFKQDSTFSNNAQRLKLDYQVTQNINLGLNTKIESSTNLLDAENQINDIQDFDKSRYGLEAVYNKPKRFSSLFLSTQYVNLNFGIARRQTQTLEEDQQYISLKARQIFKIDKRQYVYLGLDSGFLSSEQYLSNELYRLGGINSIRGFAENRFFANLFGTIQTEYRYILGSNLYIHSVLDYGFYENDIDRFSENLYSLGVGFGIETRAGVLRLIFANGGSDTQNIEFKNTQIHLKFLTVF